jgi:hypothetical protein
MSVAFSNDAVHLCEPYNTKFLGEDNREIPVTIIGTRMHASDGKVRPIVICRQKDAKDIKRLLELPDGQ